MITCDRCGDKYHDGVDGYCGLCPTCADQTDNIPFYDSILEFLKERYGPDFVAQMGETFGDLDDIMWQFCDEVTDMTERTIHGEAPPK